LQQKITAKNHSTATNHGRKIGKKATTTTKITAKIAAARIVTTKSRQQIWKLQKVGSLVTTSDLHIGIVPIVAWYGIGLDDCYRIKGMVLAHGLV
jgi:hypothetical protein